MFFSRLPSWLVSIAAFANPPLTLFTPALPQGTMNNSSPLLIRYPVVSMSTCDGNSMTPSSGPRSVETGTIRDQAHIPIHTHTHLSPRANGPRSTSEIKSFQRYSATSSPDKMPCPLPFCSSPIPRIPEVLLS